MVPSEKDIMLKLFKQYVMVNCIECFLNVNQDHTNYHSLSKFCPLKKKDKYLWSGSS